MNIYFNCFLIGLIGLALSVLTVLQSLTKKAKLANVIFPWKTFFGIDFFLQLAGSLLTIFLALMFLGPFLKQYPKFMDNTLTVLAGFATIGYVGSDIASRFFSVVNSRINGAIDYKTNQADAANGTLDTPTPATKNNPTMISKNLLIFILCCVLAVGILFTCNCHKVAKPDVVPVKEQVKAVEKKEAILQPKVDSLYKELLARDEYAKELNSELAKAQANNRRLGKIIILHDTIPGEQTIDEYTKEQVGHDLVASNVVSDSICNETIANLNQQISTGHEIINAKDSLYSNLRIAFDQSIEQQNTLTGYSKKLERKVKWTQAGKWVWKAAALVGGLFILKNAIIK